MENMEHYWQVASDLINIIDMGITGYLYYRLANPFLNKSRYAKSVAVTYFLVILTAYFIPYEMSGMFAYAMAVTAVFVVMYLIDKRNVEQKLFLAVIMYLLDWIVHGIITIPRNLLLKKIVNSLYMGLRPVLNFSCFIGVEIVCSVCGVLIWAFFIHIIDKVYICKRENMSKKELCMMLSTPCLVLTGYGTFSFFSVAYLADTQFYIWNVHSEYIWIKGLYQVISFIAIITEIAIYQSIKSGYGKEKENAVLAEQIENMKKHISEVEALYSDIRGLKHDMGNHVMTLENLFRKNEKGEAARYLTRLKEQLNEKASEIRTGNPVTDVIMKEKHKKAEENGIAFDCNFYYPGGTKINAFDISVILNNGINNALEGAMKCGNPRISICSYQKNNAYMIEITNNFTGQIVINEETGLPDTTKKDRGEHGFGLINIRNVAEKYFGCIDIEQKEESFMLSIMLMLE